MGIRRKSREHALQVLFFMDMRGEYSSEMIELYCNSWMPDDEDMHPLNDEIRPFFMKLVNGVIDNKTRIDAMIERFAKNWKLNRMFCVDRNLMRIAVYEILYCDDIPEKVSINEAIDIGKKFGTSESSAFINGILDSIRIAVEKKEI